MRTGATGLVTCHWRLEMSRRNASLLQEQKAVEPNWRGGPCLPVGASTTGLSHTPYAFMPTYELWVTGLGIEQPSKSWLVSGESEPPTP